MVKCPQCTVYPKSLSEQRTKDRLSQCAEQYRAGKTSVDNLFIAMSAVVSMFDVETAMKISRMTRKQVNTIISGQTSMEVECQVSETLSPYSSVREEFGY